jgi:hypothetical protein
MEPYLHCQCFIQRVNARQDLEIELLTVQDTYSCANTCCPHRVAFKAV